MTWLLKLYPRVWQRRYGEEVAAMLSGRGFSLAVAVDLVAGAIDVRLHPSATLAAATAATHEKDIPMSTKIAKLDCAAMLGPNISKADQWKASATTVGLTVVLTLLWMGVHIRIGDNTYVDSLSLMPIFISLLYSMRYTYLKGRPASVQAVFITGLSLAVGAIMLGAGWLTTKI